MQITKYRCANCGGAFAFSLTGSCSLMAERAYTEKSKLKLSRSIYFCAPCFGRRGYWEYGCL